jgi:hypothetical protein
VLVKNSCSATNSTATTIAPNAWSGVPTFHHDILPLVRSQSVTRSGGAPSRARTLEAVVDDSVSRLHFDEAPASEVPHHFVLLRVDEAFLREHYSAAEISTLIEAANKVCQEPSRKSPALLLLRSPRALATTGKIGGKGGNRTLDPGIMSAVL